MKKLFTQKVYYLFWILTLAVLVLGILKPKDILAYQFQDYNFSTLLIYITGGVAGFLFLLGLGYYAAIKAGKPTVLGLSLIQFLFTVIFTIWIFFPEEVKSFYQEVELGEVFSARYSTDIIILFIINMMLYSINLAWSLLRKRRTATLVMEEV